MKMATSAKHLPGTRIWILAFVIPVIVAATSCSRSETTALVPAANVLNMLISKADLPKEAVLYRFDVALEKDHRGFIQSWSGPPVSEEKGSQQRGYSYRIQVSIAESASEAVAIVRSKVLSVSESPCEVTGQAAYSSFGDRVWHKGGRLIFVRGNVVADLFVGDDGDTDHRMLYGIASRMARKIDQCVARKPEPVPVLPLAADQELRVGLEDAWKLQDLGDRLWNDKAMCIAIYDANGIPRALPAKGIGTDDYVVPLRHLAAILGSRARVEILGDEAKVTLKGKLLVFKTNKAEVQADKRAVPLDQTVEFAEGEVLVPLTSVVCSGLGQHIAWEHRGNTIVGRVNP